MVDGGQVSKAAPLAAADPPPRRRIDAPTVVFHWVVALLLLVSLATGVRIAADAQDAVWSRAVAALAPQGEVVMWHIRSACALIAAAAGYVVFLMRARLVRRVALDVRRHAGAPLALPVEALAVDQRADLLARVRARARRRWHGHADVCGIDSRVAACRRGAPPWYRLGSDWLRGPPRGRPNADGRLAGTAHDRLAAPCPWHRGGCLARGCRCRGDGPCLRRRCDDLSASSSCA